MFLPARRNVMVDYLNSPVCPCDKSVVKPPLVAERLVAPLLTAPQPEATRLPDPLDLTPRRVELKARMEAQGNLLLERALQSQMVSEIVNAQPVNETITGVKDRVH